VVKLLEKSNKTMKKERLRIAATIPAIIREGCAF
jgi:hypothetical protein